MYIYISFEVLLYFVTMNNFSTNQWDVITNPYEGAHTSILIHYTTDSILVYLCQWKITQEAMNAA